MIKLAGIISEKKELGGAMINVIDNLTDRNAHNMARLTLAKAMGNKILMKNNMNLNLMSAYGNMDFLKVCNLKNQLPWL